MSLSFYFISFLINAKSANAKKADEMYIDSLDLFEYLHVLF